MHGLGKGPCHTSAETGKTMSRSTVMSPVERVQQCWMAIAARQGCVAPAAAAALDEILSAYREPHRHYHTLDHIAVLLELLQRHTGPDNDADAVALAILLHDVV